MKCFFLFLFIAMACTTHAQEFYFRQMPTDYGSDIQQIKIIFQGTDQMIWLGTDQGLYSFDGKTYRRSPRNDGAVVPVTTIAECKNKEIWAGYEDGIVQIVTNKGLAKSINTDSIKGTPISRILFHPDGDIYIATYGAGMWRMHNEELNQLKSTQFENPHDIYDALIDQSGKIWMGTDHGILIYQDSPNRKWQTIDRHAGLPDEIVTELHEMKNGDIWVGYYDYGFSHFPYGQINNKTNIPASAEDGNMVNVVSGYENDIWLATERSVMRYDAHHDLQRFELPDQIKDRIEDMLVDRTGNIWLSSGNKLFMANTQLEVRAPGIMGIQTITSLDGMLWLGCEQGLYSMDWKSGKVIRHLPKENLNILSIYHDLQGLLWIGTFGQGLYIYDPVNRNSKHLTEDDGLSNNSILNIEGLENKVWLATLGGITEISWASEPTKSNLSITLFKDKFNFPAGYVYDIYVSRDRKVWFGTDGKGLYYLDSNQLRSFTKPIQHFGEDTFDLRTIYSITGDKENNIWVSATKGNVLKLDANGNLTDHITSAYGSLNSLNTTGKGEILMVREGIIQIKDPVIGISFFNSSTGLNSFSPNINSTSRDADGSVWIADIDKVLHYKPIYADTDRFVQTHLVDVTPGTLFDANPIRLRPDSNFIDFRFTGLWYPDPQSVQYRYMLMGHDKDWIYTQEGRAVYSKLAPGNYTFVVAGSHNEDFSHAVPVQREITVLTPFYLTWWFIVGVISLISYLTFRFVRDRIRRINRFHKLEKEKTTFQLNAIQAQVNPHFLFNSFNTLSGIIEEDQDAAVDYVDQLSAFFRGVLLHRNSELITLSEEIDIMRNYTYILKKRYGDNINIEEDIKTSEGFIVPLTLQLLIENAIKHNIVSREKPLRIMISINDEWLVVSNPVQPKFQSLIESTGFGLSSLLTRYQYLTKTRIEILNHKNIFTVKIPIIQLNPQA